jgi:hypothetical protein
VPIYEFMSNEVFGRYSVTKSRNPFTCGITGKTFSTEEAFQRREFLARALSKIMGWAPNDGTPWEKVVAVFSFNNVSMPPNH